MCRVLNVSRSGYYAWRDRSPSGRSLENEALLASIRRIHIETKKRYGAPRIYKQLQTERVPCGKNRIARLMRQEGIVPARIHRYKCATRSRQRRLLVAPNVLNRNFRVNQPNRVWAGDITCFWTGSGWLHLAVVMDLFSRRIIGWAMGNRMTEELTLGSLGMALLTRQPKHPLLHHSDQGSQYMADRFQAMLKNHQITPSMSRKGDCYDNAVLESFFKSVKAEIPWHRRFKTREEARKELFEYIEVFYNRKRLHSTLGYKSPMTYEREFNLI